jgi:hypothetical protein
MPLLVLAILRFLIEEVTTSGTKLGPHEIQSPLGAGSMGEVYRARATLVDALGAAHRPTM